MKKFVGAAALAFAFVAGSILNRSTTGASADNVNTEIVKALNIQNQQLDRIADAVERISGQRPGWKVPVER